ncbi:MAG: prenyltransferase/squalene oxidase repeat-containing protein [Phycisphaerales bacterium JB063]
MKHHNQLPLWMALLAVLGLLTAPQLAPAQDDAPPPAEGAADDAEGAREVEVVFDEDGNIMPTHFTQQTQRAIEKGLEYLARTQSNDGSWTTTQDGVTYPVSMTSLAGMAFLAGGNTTSRGPYAENVRKAVRYIMRQANPETGIIAAGAENGRTMYPHGFSLMFLACAYDMESDERVREQMRIIIQKGIILTDRAQSPLGGWMYTPNSGDEGSVTVTQLQALRAAHNAGFVVPEDVIEKSIQYLEMCRTPDGGIRYSFNSGNSTRLPISAAALPCLYAAGDYESEMAEACLKYVFKSYCLDGNDKSWSKHGGHDYYGHYYAAQAFYQAGDDYWDAYFPAARDQLINMQGQGGQGAWNGDGVGPVYGTALALTILQLPYKYLPIYQR